MGIRIPRRQWSRRPPPNLEPIPMTPEGVERLKAKLARLKHALPVAIEEAARTSAYGDRSDNAEYKEAKGILRRTQGQILRIEDDLKRIAVIPSGAGAEGTIRLGSTVDVETGGIKKTYRIVGPAETDPTRGRISHTSPLGTALLGHVRGATVSVSTPRGAQTYRILTIR